MERILLSIMVVAGLMASGCGEQKQASAPDPSAVEGQAQSLTQQVQAVAQEAAPVVAQAQQDLGNAANAMVDQAKDLLAKAQDMVNNGKFNEAINFAQQVLSIDPNNIDAKNIIETAKAKLAQMAQEKAGELKTGLSNALGN